MSDPNNESQQKGFKGLHGLGAKKPEPASGPPENPTPIAKPELPAAWQATQQGQSQQPQSKTAAPRWRAWLFTLGAIGVFIWFVSWVGENSSSNSSASSNSSPSAARRESQAVVEPSAPSEPSIDKPPVGTGRVFTSAQIRYCVYEDRRIKGAEKAVDNYDQQSVDTFNGMVDDFNSRCSNFRYRQGALAPIEREADQIHAQLEDEGRQRMMNSSLGAAPLQTSELTAIENEDIADEHVVIRESEEISTLPGISTQSVSESGSGSPPIEDEPNSYPGKAMQSQAPVSHEERSSIELACIIAKSQGPAAYRECIDVQLQQLTMAPRAPGMESLSYDEKSAIQLACIVKKSEGAASYNRCLIAQVRALDEAPRQPNLAGLSYDEKSAIQLACITSKADGAASYNRCLVAQVQALEEAPRQPNMAGLSYDEKSAIQLACITSKSDGAASYNRCLVDQLHQLESAPRVPNLNGLSYQVRSSIELACITDKSNGAAAYSRCLTAQLSSIGR